MRKSQKFIALGAVATLGLFATACGSDKAATDSTEAMASEDTVAEEVMTDDTAAVTDSTMAADPQNIVDIASANSDFSTLVSSQER